MKEKINLEIYNSLFDKNYYLSNNIFLPKLYQDNFILNESENEFILSTIRFKRVFNIDEINEENYYNIKKEIYFILKEIENIEKNYKKYFTALIKNFFQKKFNLSKEINLSISLNDNEIDFMKNEKINSIDNKISSYSEYNKNNINIEKRKFIYSLNCGIASEYMNYFYFFEKQLNGIDSKLFNYYNKLHAFCNYNIWVTPDDILLKEQNDKTNYKIYINNNNTKTISVNSENFLFCLSDTCKVLLNNLSNEKSDNLLIDYDNVWNLRLGKIFYNRIEKYINNDNMIILLNDIYNNIPNEKLLTLSKEMLLQTQLADNIFSI